jgi:hypothetical protein
VDTKATESLFSVTSAPSVVMNLEHCRDGDAFAGFVRGDDAVFQVFAAFLVGQSGLGVDGQAGQNPIAGRPFTAFDLVSRHGAAFGRPFPIEENHISSCLGASLESVTTPVWPLRL